MSRGRCGGWCLVRDDGRVIGIQELSGKEFAIIREVSTGS
jgi:hypothetical protein